MESSSNIPPLGHGYRVAYLIAQHLKDALTEGEQLELETWRSQNEANQQLFDQLTDPAYLEQEAEKYQRADTETYLGRLKEVVKERERTRVRKLWLAGAAAAVVVSAAVVFIAKPFERTATLRDTLSTVTLTQPIPEWKSWRQARLQIEGREPISLGASNHDTLLSAGLFVKGGSTLVYTGAVPNVRHALAVPARATYSVQLPDGTLVTLNAGSVLSYPAQFSGAERRVQLKGEGYFQVAKDPQKPFRVETFVFGNSTLVIEAVGTVFDVDARPGFPVNSTTLVEGKVLVQLNQDRPLPLVPNEAFLCLGLRSLQKVSVDAAAATAWVKHRFKFNDTPLIDALRQLALWYNVDLDIPSLPAIHVNGDFSRDESLDHILQLLSLMGAFHYRLNEQRITILK